MSRLSLGGNPNKRQYTRRHSMSELPSSCLPSLLENETNKDKDKSMIVAVRVRPLSQKEIDNGNKSCCNVINGNIVAISKEGEAGGYLKSQLGSVIDYGFDVAFDTDATQLEVYEKTAKKFIPNVISGLNVTVFAYGATGAGKTHTMLGNTRADEAANHADAGIIPNAVFDLFSQINEKNANLLYGEEYSIIISFIEVYNEQVYDLLDQTGKILSLREDQDKGVVVVAGVTEKNVTNYDEVMNLLSHGNKNRKTESTMANDVSSRSHAVLQIMVKHKTRTDGGREHIIESKLSLIDLAGSERASATNNRGARLQEGANINKSLLALANCINALAGNNNGKKVNVKYRDSKLTHLLKSSLEGNCNLVMIANVNPSDTTYEDSHNTLKYSNRAKNIKVNPLIKINAKDSNWLEREIALRDEIAMLRNKVIELELVIVNMKNEKKNYNNDISIEKISNESAFVEEVNENNKSNSIGYWMEDNDCQYDDYSNTNVEIINNDDNIDSSSKKRQLEDDNNEVTNRNNHVCNNVSMLSDSILMAGLFADEEDEEKIVENPMKKRRSSMIPSVKGEKLSNIIAPESTLELDSNVTSFLPKRSSRLSISNQVKVDKPLMEGIRKSSRISISKDDIQNENLNPNIIIVKSNISNLKASINNNGRRKSLAAVSALLENIPGQNQDLDIKTNNMEIKIKGGLKDKNNSIGGGITDFVKRMSNKVVNRKSKAISDENIWIDI